jgi:nucleoside phosphorylase
MLGIAAAIHTDIQLGDVVAASHVDGYMATTRARRKDRHDFEFARRGTVFETSHAFLAELLHLPIAQREAFLSWQQAAEPEAETLRQVMADLKGNTSIPSRPNLHIAKLASGPVLSTSRAFANWILERDETLKALDMESAGFAGALTRRIDSALSLVLRGISDFGDERKRSLDRKTHGLIRQYALRNTARLLSALARCDLLPRVQEVAHADTIGQKPLDAVSIDRLAPLTLREALARIQPSSIPTFDDTRERLRDAYRRRNVMRLSAADTREVDAAIIDLRRTLRDIGALQQGSIIGDGRYELVDELGNGGYGAVWKAYDYALDEFVAIKTLQDRWARDESRRRRFFRGARVMWRFNHPNIVRILEPEGHDGPYEYYVMEYVDGTNLERCVLSDAVDSASGLRAVVNIADAVHYAHIHGCIHRDVKPSNILLGKSVVKLGDFDLVKPFDTTGGTQTSILGTVAFCAPEMLLTPAVCDYRSDVCSLGKTAVFVLTGRRYNWEQMLEPAAVINALPVSDDLKDVLRKSTAREINARHTSAEAFAADLRAAIARGVAPRPRITRLDNDDWDNWGPEAVT